MAKKGIDFLHEQLEITKRVTKELERQVKYFDRVVDEVIENVKDEDEKQKIIQVKALSNLAFKRAKRGVGYEDLLKKMKKMIRNGRNSNTEEL